MRCKLCGQYIPEGLGIKQCSCGAELQEDTCLIEKESDLITNESNTTEEKNQIVTELLSKKQEEQIDERMEREIKNVFKMGVFFMIMVIATFIPIYSRRGYDLGGVSAMMFFGYIPTTLFLIAVGSIMFFFTIRQSKILGLKKDLKEKKAIVISAKVSYIRELKGDSQKEYDVFLEKNEASLNKIHFYFDEFPEIKEGDFVKLTLTPNAHFVLSTENLNGKLFSKRDF